jgi:hypothetical protein
MLTQQSQWLQTNNQLSQADMLMPIQGGRYAAVQQTNDSLTNTAPMRPAAIRLHQANCAAPELNHPAVLLPGHTQLHRLHPRQPMSCCAFQLHGLSAVAHTKPNISHLKGSTTHQASTVSAPDRVHMRIHTTVWTQPLGETAQAKQAQADNTPGVHTATRKQVRLLRRGEA